MGAAEGICAPVERAEPESSFFSSALPGSEVAHLRGSRVELAADSRRDSRKDDYSRRDSTRREGGLSKGKRFWHDKMQISVASQALFDAAAAGELGTPEGIEAQVDRMLADPKALALVENFAGQWLLIRSLDDHVPDYDTFPAYDDSLRDAFRNEAELFFQEFLKGEIPINQILTAEFTYLNDRLADHYQLPFSGGAQFDSSKASVDAARSIAPKQPRGAKRRATSSKLTSDAARSSALRFRAIDGAVDAVETAAGIHLLYRSA